VLDIAPDVVDGAPLPDTWAEAREKWRLVDEALASLDARRRAVLIMHDFEGHTGREIAQALGVSLKTVFSRLYAAREHLLHAATRTTFEPPPLTLLAAVNRLRLSSAG
jgi:RNA polymerase sigma factor (sigma-70 family)